MAMLNAAASGNPMTITEVVTSFTGVDENMAERIRQQKEEELRKHLESKGQAESVEIMFVSWS
jgi:hypothetical protein